MESLPRSSEAQPSSRAIVGAREDTKPPSARPGGPRTALPGAPRLGPPRDAESTVAEPQGVCDRSDPRAAFRGMAARSPAPPGWAPGVGWRAVLIPPSAEGRALGPHVADS